MTLLHLIKVQGNHQNSPATTIIEAEVWLLAIPLLKSNASIFFVLGNWFFDFWYGFFFPTWNVQNLDLAILWEKCYLNASIYQLIRHLTLILLWYLQYQVLVLEKFASKKKVKLKSVQSVLFCFRLLVLW